MSYTPEEIESALTEAKALLRHRHGDNRRALVEIIEQLRADLRHMDSERALAGDEAQHWATRAMRAETKLEHAEQQHAKLIDALEAILEIPRPREVQGDTAFAVIVNARSDGYNLALDAVRAAAKAHE
jgi:hypothetical protein